MPTATFTFDLSDPDERLEYLRYAHSLDMAIALWEIVHNMRKTMQLEVSKNESFDNADTIDFVFDSIIKKLNEHSIDVNKLIN